MGTSACMMTLELQAVIKMVDISSQLQIIAGEESGEVVRNAIADASYILAQSGIDIDPELATIRTNRYGYEIRMAIHNALYKLSQMAPTPTPPSPTPTVDAQYGMTSVMHGVQANIEHNTYIIGSGYERAVVIPQLSQGHIYGKTWETLSDWSSRTGDDSHDNDEYWVGAEVPVYRGVSYGPVAIRIDAKLTNGDRPYILPLLVASHSLAQKLDETPQGFLKAKGYTYGDTDNANFVRIADSRFLEFEDGYIIRSDAATDNEKIWPISYLLLSMSTEAYKGATTLSDIEYCIVYMYY